MHTKTGFVLVSRLSVSLNTRNSSSQLSCLSMMSHMRCSRDGLLRFAVISFAMVDDFILDNPLKSGGLGFCQTVYRLYQFVSTQIRKNLLEKNMGSPLEGFALLSPLSHRTVLLALVVT